MARKGEENPGWCGVREAKRDKYVEKNVLNEWSWAVKWQEGREGPITFGFVDVMGSAIARKHSSLPSSLVTVSPLAHNTVCNRDVVSECLLQLNMSMKPGSVNRSVVRPFWKDPWRSWIQRQKLPCPHCCLGRGLGGWSPSSHCVCRRVCTTM